MKRLMTILVCLVLAAATVQALEPGDYGGAMGVFFSDTEFNETTANLDDPPAVFDFYVVIVDCQFQTLGGYECGLTIEGDGLEVIDAGGGPVNWYNVFDSPTNHGVVFGGSFWPVLPSGEIVISTLTATYTGSETVEIIMGPSDPSSGPAFDWDGPVIVVDGDPELLLVCHLTSGAAGYPDVVATINGQPVAAESRCWTEVKSLFD